MKAPFRVLHKLVKRGQTDLGTFETVYMFLNSSRLPFSYFKQKGFSFGELPKNKSPLFVLYFLKEKDKMVLLQDKGDYLLLPKGE